MLPDPDAATANPAEQPPLFRVEVQANNGEVRLKPIGELDLVTAPELDLELDALRRRRIERLVLDLQGLTFMDSAGLHLILDWDSLARRERIGFSVIAGAGNIQRVFEITGLADQIALKAD